MGEFDAIFLIVIVVVLAAGAGSWMLRRGRAADQPGDRVPDPSHAQATSGAAVVGATLSDHPHDGGHGGDSNGGGNGGD